MCLGVSPVEGEARDGWAGTRFGRNGQAAGAREQFCGPPEITGRGRRFKLGGGRCGGPPASREGEDDGNAR